MNRGLYFCRPSSILEKDHNNCMVELRLRIPLQNYYLKAEILQPYTRLCKVRLGEVRLG